MFRKALLGQRQLRRAKSWNNASSAVLSVHPQDHDTTGQLSDRDTLVFEREITLNTGGQSRRWSLHVPANSMNPEMVDLMLELKDLNSHFRSDSEVANCAVQSPDEWPRNVLVPPALMVSNSDSSVPLLLDSIGESPLALAVRRGQKMPPPLSFKREEQDLYPSIPTAFLGSPSTYSPKLEFVNRYGDQSMDLEDMVANLRSHCSAIDGSSSRPPSSLGQTQMNGLSTHSETDRAAVEVENEWAFANNLLETYGGKTHCDTGFSPDSNRFPLPSPSESLLQNSSTDIDSESATGASDQSPDTSVESIDLCHTQTIIQPRQYYSKTTASPPSNPAPSTLLPLRPTLISPTSPKFTRGILKRCKSVRFASLPSRRASPPCVSKSPVTVSRCSTSTSIGTPFHGPSPLRSHFAPQTGPRSLRTTPHTPPVSQAAASTRAPLASGKKPVLTPTPAGRSQSTLTPTAASTKRVTAHTFPFRRPVAKQSPEAPGKPPRQTKSSLGRHSLGKLIRTSPGKGKENKASDSPPPDSRYSTLDENVLRRSASAAGHIETGTNKSRMPVPLRNIFTRFK